MEELLFLTQRIPFPPIKGEKIRPLQILRFLRQRYIIHLGCFIDDPADWQYVDTIREMCSGETHFAPLYPPVAKLACLRGLLGSSPLSVPYFFNRRLSSWVTDLINRRQLAAAFVCSSAMGQYLLGQTHRPPRIVMDFADVDSDKWRQYAATQAWPMNWIYARESRTLLAFDREVGRHFHASVFVSPAEAKLFKSLAPELADKTHYVNSGVDSEYFSPNATYNDPYGAEPTVVFTGTMNYWPNVDAVTWFVDQVLPRARQRVSNLRLCIVGSHPDPKVLRLKNVPGVTVTGRVPDVRPYVAHAVAVIVPLRIANGVQNKVLEAMAMAKVVIATPRALSGIEPEAARRVLVAEGVEEFAEAVGRAVLGDCAPDLGTSARSCVLDLYSWEKNLAGFTRLL
jgi:sugar transferase (PEP-CTERM/EpsH1 system associated)